MFNQFPKTRPPLPREIRQIYTACYKENRQGQTVMSSMSNKLESWLHKQVAKDIAQKRSQRTTLEIGAGTLNHLPFEPVAAAHDIVEPFRELYEESPLLGRIRNIYADTAEIPEHHRYDRITSVGTFEHICNLPEVVARCGLLLAPNGSLRIGIPSEGTFLYKLAWRLTTGLEFRIRHGLDYGLLMRHEHVNSAAEIEEVLHFFFADITSRVFGVSKSLSLFRFYACQNPHPEKCRRFTPARPGKSPT